MKSDSPLHAITARRVALGLSQKELADAAGVSARSIHNLETGKNWPLDVNRARIEAVLGWAPGSLDAIRDGNEPVLLVVDQETASSQRPTDETSRHPEPVHPNLDDVLALNQIRSSARILDQLPAPVRAVVLAQAREHLEAVVDFLDEQRAQELVLEAYRLLDEQYPPSPTVTSLDGWRSNRADEDVAPLPYVADSSADEPEMGDDGYHDGP